MTFPADANVMIVSFKSVWGRVWSDDEGYTSLAVVLEVDDESDDAELDHHDHTLYQLVGQYSTRHRTQRTLRLLDRVVCFRQLMEGRFNEQRQSRGGE